MFSTGRAKKSERAYTRNEILEAAGAELDGRTGVYEFSHEYGRRNKRQRQFATVVRLRNVYTNRLVDFFDDGVADNQGNPHCQLKSLIGALKKNFEGVPIFVADEPMPPINGNPVPVANEHTKKLSKKYAEWANERDKNSARQTVDAEKAAEKEATKGKAAKGTRSKADG